MLGFLGHNFSRAPTSLKLHLYKTLVRPKIEYASSVWNPHSANLVSILEAIQNRAAHFIVSDYSRSTSVTNKKKNITTTSSSNPPHDKLPMCFSSNILHQSDVKTIPFFSSNAHVVTHRSSVKSWCAKLPNKPLPELVCSNDQLAVESPSSLHCLHKWHCALQVHSQQPLPVTGLVFFYCFLLAYYCTSPHCNASRPWE